MLTHTHTYTRRHSHTFITSFTSCHVSCRVTRDADKRVTKRIARLLSSLWFLNCGKFKVSPPLPPRTWETFPSVVVEVWCGGGGAGEVEEGAGYWVTWNIISFCGHFCLLSAICFLWLFLAKCRASLGFGIWDFREERAGRERGPGLSAVVFQCQSHSGSATATTTTTTESCFCGWVNKVLSMLCESFVGYTERKDTFIQAINRVAKCQFHGTQTTPDTNYHNCSNNNWKTNTFRSKNNKLWVGPNRVVRVARTLEIITH